MKSYSGALALAYVFLGTCAQAEDVGSVLDEGRRALTGARLVATDTLQRTGTLPPQQLAVVNSMIADAQTIWTACIILEVDRLSSGGSTNTAVADQALLGCKRDRDELVAWMRFAGQAHRKEIPPDKLAEFVRTEERWQREKAIERAAMTRARR